MHKGKNIRGNTFPANLHQTPDDILNALPSHVRDLLEEKGYKMVRHLGKGGSASVFLVESIKFHEEFVLKWIDCHESSPTQFQNEIETLKSLNFSNIIKIYDYEITENSIALFLEYCPNGSLNDKIANGPIQRNKLIPIIHDIISTIAYIHAKNIAHSDIKPSNILIDKYGRIKFADFGLSKKYENKTCNLKIGSLSFMAPECFSNSTFDPFAADIWALRVTIYILAIGSSPWTSSKDYLSIRRSIEAGCIEFPRSLDSNLRRLLSNTLNYHPCNRPPASVLLQDPIFVMPSDPRAVVCPKKDNRNLIKPNQPQPSSEGRRFSLTSALINPNSRNSRVYLATGIKLKTKNKSNSVKPMNTFETEI
ncbi:CAMK family protein kinase [Tritrichomonas foetus]|uniref:CAMK family protein kinase n=1 Tax=Tritrichomonas foetus TaxID=1144522 RepID=A0A1J4KTC7_9EUKA|nr:CAMK family protein kinase [Tritrichomonas foetus]|eukprot:OHT14136.1 CAMK family protein kinase [Tritrichomonas foetus]